MLDEIGDGRVISYITAMFEDTRKRLQERKPNLQELTARIHRDRVYEAIATGEFRCPIVNCKSADKLRATVGTLREITGGSKEQTKALGSYLNAVERFLRSNMRDWTEHGYFTVPVIQTSGQPGLVYLRAVRTPDMPRMAPRRFHTEDLTRDPRLIDYLDGLVVTLMKKLHFVETYPRDPFASMVSYGYRLHFGCQITEGKSMGAAALVLFCMCYLRAMLGPTVTNLIDPVPGMLITGGIAPDGRVETVGDLERKVLCAAEEYGPEIKMILPAGQEVKLGIAYAKNVFYVSTVEDLLREALSARRDSRGLESCREALFGSLSADLKEELRQYLVFGVPRDIYERPQRYSEPVSHETGVSTLCAACDDRFDISVGADADSVRDSPVRHQRRLIQLILDASSGADQHWIPDERTGLSRMGVVLFEFARSFDFENEDLVVGFLSQNRFEPIAYGTLARDLEERFQSLRTSLELPGRGAFVRPLREASLSNEEYRSRPKRIFLISEAEPPDWNDVDDTLAEPPERLSPVPSDIRRSLFRHDGTLNRNVLNLRFHRQAVSLSDIQVDPGSDLPVQWEPDDGILVRENGGYSLRWSGSGKTKWSMRVRLFGAFPQQIRVTGKVVRDGTLQDVSCVAYPSVRSLPQMELNREGDLVPGDFGLWRTICTVGKTCPECEVSSVHLFHESDIELRRKLALPDLDRLSLGHGWLMLRESDPHWVIFKTGYIGAGWAVVILDGLLHYSPKAGVLEQVPADDTAPGLYRLDREETTYYLVYL